MSATDELRRLLDERGVEYRRDNGTVTWYVDGVMYNAWGFDNERLTMSVCHLTPAQVIAATLGPRNDSYNCTNGERTDLAAENAKLRELVCKMMQFFEDGDWCTTCECVQECDAQEQYEEDCLMRCVFHDRMHELGVEASE